MRISKAKILAFFILIAGNINAQSPFWFLGQRKKEPYEAIKYVPYATISIGAGSSNYFGELVPNTIFSSNSLLSTRWNLGLTYTKHFHKRFSYKASLSYIRIAGDDNYYNLKTGDEGTYFAANFARNLHFRNDLKELALSGIYELKRQTPYRMKRPDVSPYVFAGFAILLSEPQARGMTTNQTSAANWVSLRNMAGYSFSQKGTEGVSYSPFTYAIPLGFGIRYKLDKYIDLGFEATYRFVFSDYLDDVSDERNTIDAPINDFTIRSGEKIAANTLKALPTSFTPTTDLVTSSGKDSYFTTQIQLILHFGNAAGKSQAGSW